MIRARTARSLICEQREPCSRRIERAWRDSQQRTGRSSQRSLERHSHRCWQTPDPGSWHSPRRARRTSLSSSAQAHAGHSFSFWRPVAGDTALTDRAMSALAQAGLAAKADVSVSALAHGERRQLEIAMTLATQPQLLLLDMDAPTAFRCWYTDASSRAATPPRFVPTPTCAPRTLATRISSHKLFRNPWPCSTSPTSPRRTASARRCSGCRSPSRRASASPCWGVTAWARRRR